MTLTLEQLDELDKAADYCTHLGMGSMYHSAATPAVVRHLVALYRAALAMKRAIDIADQISLTNDRVQTPDVEAQLAAEVTERRTMRAVCDVLRGAQ